jgi:hypothetical protein
VVREPLTEAPSHDRLGIQAARTIPECCPASSSLRSLGLGDMMVHDPGRESLPPSQGDSRRVDRSARDGASEHHPVASLPAARRALARVRWRDAARPVARLTGRARPGRHSPGPTWKAPTRTLPRRIQVGAAMREGEFLARVVRAHGLDRHVTGTPRVAAQGAEAPARRNSVLEDGEFQNAMAGIDAAGSIVTVVPVVMSMAVMIDVGGTSRGPIRCARASRVRSRG